MRVATRGLAVLGAGLLLLVTGAPPAVAGGSWMYGEWDRYEAGETVTMVGYFGAGQQGGLEDGPFFANVRRQAQSETDQPPSLVIAPATFTSTVLQDRIIGTYTQMRVETTFTLPPDLPPGQYNVVVCNTGCKKGIGDLIGGPLPVGVNAEWAYQRGWPADDPSYARSQAQPADRRGVDPLPDPSTVVATTVAPRAVTPTTIATATTLATTTTTTTVATTSEVVVAVPRPSIIEPVAVSAPSPKAADATTNWGGIFATSAVVTAAVVAGVVVRRRGRPTDEPVSSERESREVTAREVNARDVPVR